MVVFFKLSVAYKVLYNHAPNFLVSFPDKIPTLQPILQMTHLQLT